MNFKRLRGLAKPEYFYRPTQLLRRLLPRSQAESVQELPWGWPLTVNPQEDIGRAIQTLGVYDLVVSEAILRLVDPGDATADVGANIGYMSAVLAHAVQGGRVESFEPHPLIFAKLCKNAELWREAGAQAAINCHQIAASDTVGSGTLVLPQHFAKNNGVAYVGEEPVAGLDHVSIELAPLDDLLGKIDFISLLKIDVEGHEFKAFGGAKQLLSAGRIRDILFEDHGKPETPVMTLLKTHGYRLFRLVRTFRGPRLTAVDDDGRQSFWEPANFLATLDPERVAQRFDARGWRVLR